MIFSLFQICGNSGKSINDGFPIRENEQRFFILSHHQGNSSVGVVNHRRNVRKSHLKIEGKSIVDAL